MKTNNQEDVQLYQMIHSQLYPLTSRLFDCSRLYTHDDTQ